jgi:hypothetical protein
MAFSSTILPQFQRKAGEAGSQSQAARPGACEPPEAFEAFRQSAKHAETFRPGQRKIIAAL